ncbi:hypothetical protein [Pedobacter zeae]|uniref:Uncharacterized protein n=1 Tax=Pedobacter zeae TaxID=1737356 RepID=A0A7W6P5D8_9SPHI|nr:hypothetical protein [Pedobacter zeae]MBB4107723.1 hypothetical protein [Pedobacter zeae]GGG97485.1 hypothetical protein GCM10007422_09310 [Pedobacter zeae]
MKTAEEYLKDENCISNSNGVFIYKGGFHRINLAAILEDYAKLYANQKLDEAAEKANITTTSIFFGNKPVVDKQSILSLKDKV